MNNIIKNAPDSNADSRSSAKATLNLADYYPYRLAILSHEISRAFTPLYQQRYDLNRQEWRVLAALGENPHLSSKEISDYSTLEKMQVSRAIASMMTKNLLVQIESGQDKRQKRVKLSKKGTRVYKNIIPLALAREKFILSSLSKEEVKLFDKIIDHMVSKARQLQEWG